MRNFVVAVVTCDQPAFDSCVVAIWSWHLAIMYQQQKKKKKINKKKFKSAMSNSSERMNTADIR